MIEDANGLLSVDESGEEFVLVCAPLLMGKRERKEKERKKKRRKG